MQDPVHCHMLLQQIHKRESTNIPILYMAASIRVTYFLWCLKIEAVVRRILWIKSQDPNEKVLVFSSWNDVLDVLEHAFTANDITYSRMKGGR